jgi:mono/diheme cytochrome c family protein
MLIAMAIGAVVPMAGSNLVAAEPVTFEKHVRPILKTHCFLCHGEAGVTKGKLDLRLRRWLVRGGESGAAIVAGKPSESYLLSRISSGEMPPGDKKLSVTEIDVIRRWIAAGATTARPEPETIQGNEYLSEEDRSYWAFQPVKRPDVPRVQDSQQVHTQIDAFLLKRLR